MYTDSSGWILIVCTSVFTLVAAVIDYRTQRIPNKLTVPAFVLGWVYQFYAHGAAGLLDGLQGFAIGFGMYFVLWLIGGGGGGDAKLAGAVSVWLGFRNTLGMIVVSTVFVILGTGFVLVWSMLTRGVFKTKDKLLPNSNPSGKPKKQMELLKFNRGRIGMTFALSVALATICTTLFAVPDWPYRKAAQAAREERAARHRQKQREESVPAERSEKPSEKSVASEKNS